MGSAEKVSWKRVLILAGAIIAFTIGSGFATGQEIIQYIQHMEVNDTCNFGIPGSFSLLQF